MVIMLDYTFAEGKEAYSNWRNANFASKHLAPHPSLGCYSSLWSAQGYSDQFEYRFRNLGLSSTSPVIPPLAHLRDIKPQDPFWNYFLGLGQSLTGSRSLPAWSSVHKEWVSSAPQDACLTTVSLEVRIRSYHPWHPVSLLSQMLLSHLHHDLYFSINTNIQLLLYKTNKLSL